MKIATFLGKVTISVIVFFVLFLVAAVISEVTADRKFVSQLFMALLFPSLVAIWYRTETSKRIIAAVLGSVAGIAIWGLGLTMFYSGLSRNPFIASAVISGSMLASGVLALVVCRRKKASQNEQTGGPMTKAKAALWVLGLLSGTIIWALLMNTALFGEKTGNFMSQMGVALGMGSPVFFITGAIAGIVYFFKRKPSTAMWTWTVLLLVTLVVLGVGGVRQAAS